MYRDTPAWAQGHRGELVVARWLKEQGYYILRAADIAGGAPMLEGGRPLVVPDLQASANGATRWVEVKTKGGPTRCQRHKREEHGVHQRNWADYLAVEERTGIPGYLAILELRTGILIMASLQQLNVVREHSVMYNGPHWFFPRHVFDWYDYREGVEGFEPIQAAAPRTLAAPPPPRHKQLSLEL